MKAQNDFVDSSVTASTQAYCCPPRVLVWSAIIAGALIVFGLTFLLQIFDKALGIQILKTSTESGTEAMVWGGFIASIIGIIATMFFAGWVSGHIAKYHIYHNNVFTGYSYARHYGLLYGLLTWCLGLLLSLIFITHMGIAQYHHPYRAQNPSLSVVGMTVHHAASEATQGTPDRNNTSATNSVSEQTDNAQRTSPFEVSLFLTFILFFLGAISSSFGGYCGMKPYRLEGTSSAKMTSR